MILGFVLSILPAMALNLLIVAVPQSSGKDGPILNVSKPFQVLLNNTSLRDSKVWSEWNSKGYLNLSFEFRGPDGKIVMVEKNRNVFWFKHTPKEIVIQPGCAYSIKVDFSSRKEWTGVKSLNGKMTMQVIYRNMDQAPTGSAPLIKSDPISVVILH